MLKITLDTNTVRPEQMSAAIRKIRGEADVATTTTVVREIGSVYDPSLYRLHVVPELWVMGESPLGVAVLVSEADRDLFEAILAAITNGSFPKPDRRATLTRRNFTRDLAARRGAGLNMASLLPLVRAQWLLGNRTEIGCVGKSSMPR